MLLRLTLLLAVLAADSSQTAARHAPAPPDRLAAALDSLFTSSHSAGQFHGAALVAIDESPVYRAAFGLADRTWDVPNAPDTRFRIASVTKSFTAYLVLRLVQEGLMELDAPLATYLPDVAGTERYTIHQLLANTAGIPHYEGLKEASMTVQTFRPQAFAPLPYAELIAGLPLHHAPGSAFHYSSFGYDLLGAAVEAVTGLSYGEALARYITEPLGLADTGYVPHDAVVPRLAEGYEPAPGDTTGSAFVPAPYRHPSNAYAAGGLYSTADDLLRWSHELQHGTLLEPALRERMQTNHATDVSAAVSYGYGLAVHDGDGAYSFGEIGLARPYVIHGGSYDGYRALFVSAEGGSATIVLLSNAGAATDEIGLGRAVAALINRYGSE